MSNGSTLRSLAGPAYLIAALLVVLPVVDFATNVWPLQPGQFVWRYGSVGLFSSFMLTPLLGLLLACGIAAASGHRRTLGVLGGASLAIAVVSLLVIGLFLLDAFQARASVPAEGRARFNVGIWRAVLKYLAFAAALGWLGAATWRAGRRAGRASSAGRKAPPLVGQQTKER